MRRSVLIYNPTSGRQVARRQLPAIVADLEGGGFSVEALPTAAPGDATRLAREAAGDVEVVFALGGDGTLREVAAGILGWEVAVGVLPTGTTNVMARAFGLPSTARAAARVLPRCEPRAIDVGVAGDDIFLMCATGGLDAAVMSLQDSRLKRLFGRAAMVSPALRQWWLYGYPDLEVRADGRRRQVSYFAACNAPFYAGAFRMAPAADLSDGLLDLILFRGRGRLRTLGFARDLAVGRHVRRYDVESLRVEELEILHPPDVRVQLDGDVPAVTAPLRIGLAPHRLRVLAPPPRPG